MKKYLVQNLEVYVVSYVVDAESETEALSKYVELGAEIDLEYMCDLNEYTNKSFPYVQEVIEA